MPFYIRCFVKRTGDQWVAVCIDLGLAAQDDSYEGAKARLVAQVTDYVHQALTIDREHAHELLTRRSPLPHIIEYYWIRLRQAVRQSLSHRKLRSAAAFEELVTGAA